MKRFASILLLSGLFSLSPGCTVMHQIAENDVETSLRSKGYDPNHIDSCEPLALEGLLNNLEIREYSQDISRYILNHNLGGSLLRQVFGIIDREATQITWPHEIEGYLRKRLGDKYDIRVINTNLPNQLSTIISQNKNAIVLVGSKKDIFKHHWMKLPSAHDLKEDYEKGKASIEMIYLVEPKHSFPIATPPKYISPRQ